MSNKQIEELIAMADRLCNTLDVVSQNDMAFCNTIQNELERMSYETYKISNNLKQIQTWGT
jgi:hypothetical protein